MSATGIGAAHLERLGLAQPSSSPQAAHNRQIQTMLAPAINYYSAIGKAAAKTLQAKKANATAAKA